MELGAGECVVVFKHVAVASVPDDVVRGRCSPEMAIVMVDGSQWTTMDHNAPVTDVNAAYFSSRSGVIRYRLRHLISLTWIRYRLYMPRLGGEGRGRKDQACISLHQPSPARQLVLA
jgi:hypothetical protein